MSAIAFPMRSRRASLGTPLLRRPSAMLSNTVFQGKSANCWNTTARSGPGPVMRRPPTATDPWLGNSNPAASRRQVVLPQPDGPTIATNSLSAIERSTRSSAGKSMPARRKVLATASKVMAAISGEPAPAHLRLERAQADVDRKPDEADRDHAAHHRRGRDVELRLHHHEADARRGDDELGADQRLPTEPRRDPEARDDRGHRGGQQHLDDDA